MIVIVSIIAAVFFVLWLESLIGRVRIKSQYRTREERLNDEIRRISYDTKNLAARVKWLNLTYSQLLSSVIHLSSMLSLDEIKEAVLRVIANAIDCHEIAFFMSDDKEEYLKPVASLGIPKNILYRLSYRFGEGRVGLVAKRRLALTEKEFTFYLRNETGQEVFKPQICSPIIFSTKLYGVIGIGGLKKVTDDQRQIVNFIATAAGMALNNALSFKRLQYSASIDKLTGLYNMQFFRDRLNDAVKGAKANGKPVSVCLTDLDHFKNFNDTFGHPMGDRLLYRITRIFAECLPDMVIARYGGDEFIIFAEGKNRDQMSEIANKVRRRIEEENLSAGKRERITLSAGVAAYPDDATSAEELVKMADQALYMAKEKGRNRVMLYVPTV